MLYPRQAACITCAEHISHVSIFFMASSMHTSIFTTVDALMVLTSAYHDAQRVLTTKTIAQAGELVHELPSVAAGFHVAALCEP